MPCEDSIPKIRNKYSQTRNCKASVLIPTFMFLSDLYISTISLPILLHENRWTDRGNILFAHRHMNVEIGTEAAQFSFLGVHKSDFLCSVQAAFCTKKSTVYSFNSAFLLKVFCFIKSCKLQWVICCDR
jgi:hypothetical protein